ncbi:transcriptional regulator domain-containing protein [Bradyrhizobium japonicum]|uniref:transcriptional regulator domain-containing protein n=1 Tax=Bradyrhizobium japonicum TaxID=375 RepID=UPI0009B7ADE3
MSGFDWRSREAYANMEKAEAVDVAWEWLRRNGDYERDYRALKGSGINDRLRQQWGLSFRS